MRLFLAGIGLFLAAGTSAQTVINTSLLQISGDDVVGSTWFGTPFSMSIQGTPAGAVAVLYVKGNLAVPSDRTIRIQGSRPLRILVGGDCTIDSFAIFDASATGRLGVAGGGDGALGGPGAPGGLPSFASGPNNAWGAGGAGGRPNVCIFTNGYAGGYGTAGGYGVATEKGWSGGAGVPGSIGAPGFGKSPVGLTPANGGAPGAGGAAASSAPGGKGGAGGAGGYASGDRGRDGEWGYAGVFGGYGYAGGQGGDAPNPMIEIPRADADLWAGSGGASGAGGGGGGSGGTGSPGGAGGGGGGGGATSCVSGGWGGLGGAGGAPGNGGAGGQGGAGADGGGGGGAFELASLGRLEFAGYARAWGADCGIATSGASGTYGTLIPQSGKYGSPGTAGSSGSGDGGTGGRGGDGGQGGYGAPGGYGGRGAGGTGGTVKLSAAELFLRYPRFDVHGGFSSSSSTWTVPGYLSLASHYQNAPASLISGGTIVQSPGPMGPSPYFAGSPQTAYLAGLDGGGAIGGTLSLAAASLVKSAPADAAAALVWVTVVPGNSYISPTKPAIALVPLAPRRLEAPAMCVGSTGLLAPAMIFGWANDPSFGGGGPVPLNELSRGKVYLTSMPAGSGVGAAAVSIVYQGKVRSAATTSFGPGAPLYVLVPPCAEDLNGDAMVDDADFSLFVEMYNILDCADESMPASCAADFNHDGLVEDSDFQIFLAAYSALLCP
ncbi:MAG: hypothetical protein U0570_04265 [Phycisphaerales bacterium]